MGIEDCITFHGETVKDLKAGFRAAIDHYVADCTATGRQPLKPASGKPVLRIPPETHTRALTAAKASGKSLTQRTTEVLDKAAHIRSKS
jgi:predicted HicB family RNase H-like nuclease